MCHPIMRSLIQYMDKTVPRMFPNINLLPTMANGIKNTINSLKSKKLMWLWRNIDKITQNLLRLY
jgi:hypothetical protein